MEAIQSEYSGIRIDVEPDYEGPPGRISIIIKEKDGKGKTVWTGTRSQSQNDLPKILKIVETQLL